MIYNHKSTESLKEMNNEENVPSPIASDPFIMRKRLHDSINILKSQVGLIKTAYLDNPLN